MKILPLLLRQTCRRWPMTLNGVMRVAMAVLPASRQDEYRNILSHNSSTESELTLQVGR